MSIFLMTTKILFRIFRVLFKEGPATTVTLNGYRLAIILTCSTLPAATYGQSELKHIATQKTAIDKITQNAQSAMLAGYLDSSKLLFLDAYRQYYFINNTPGIIKSLLGLGNIASNEGAYSLAIDLYNNALKNADHPGSNKTKIGIFKNISGVYSKTGDLKTSMFYLFRGITLAENYYSHATDIPLDGLYVNLANILTQLNQPEKAHYYLNKAEKISLKSKNHYALFDLYLAKGSAYTATGKTDLSKKNLLLALNYALQGNYVLGQQNAHVQIGILEVNRNNYIPAIQSLQEADKLKGANDATMECLRLVALAKAYIGLKNFKEAEVLLTRAYSLTKKIQNPSFHIAVHRILTELYDRTGDFEQAFQHLYEEKRISDSVQYVTSAQNISALEIKYRTEQSEKQLLEQKLLINQQKDSIYKRNVWIAITCGSLLLLALLFIYVRKSYRQKQHLKEMALNNLKQEQELNEIKAKINGEEIERTRISRELHDSVLVEFSAVKMSLNAILNNDGDLIPKKGIKPIVLQLDDATAGLRSTAHNLMPDMLLEQGLAEALHYYIGKMQRKIHFTIDFHQIGTIPRIDPDFELDLYRITQELLQNALKHAAPTQVIVQLSYEHDLLSITVEDDGKGFIITNQEQESWGLKSIKNRVKKFKGNFEIESKISVGTTVRIEFENCFLN